MLQVHADPCPGAEPAAHGIDEHVGRLQMRSRFLVAFFPALETGERCILVRRPANFDQRIFPPSLFELRRTCRWPPLRGLDACGLAGLFPVMRRPRRVALSFAFLLGRELEQPLDRARMIVDAGVTVANLSE